MRLGRESKTFLILQSAACRFLYTIFLYKQSHTLEFQCKAKDCWNCTKALRWYLTTENLC